MQVRVHLTQFCQCENESAVSCPIDLAWLGRIWSITSNCATKRSFCPRVERKRSIELLSFNKVHLNTIAGVLTGLCPIGNLNLRSVQLTYYIYINIHTFIWWLKNKYKLTWRIAVKNPWGLKNPVIQNTFRNIFPNLIRAYSVK